ncbi:malto-oligosyltrehalose trehalohydrolase [Georgenia halophila]|uniref:Malto-oligosyltrehalose trehalohydrolase n=1 Tax=Georgenia halophila TaxID=620889 RepID=A0ABP8LRE0_9MICO
MRVWAPAASAVDLVDGGPQPEPMVAQGGGWWRSPEPVPAGTDYAFSLDGGPPRPDPRSPWQPHGVHEASRTFDAGAHRWRDGDWRGRSVLGAVVYELHVGTFTPEGTLDAAIGRLDHLVELGVGVVELMPVAAFPGDHGWGYDGVALYAVHDPYGGPAALQRFVDAAHGRGLAVCLDVVYNHLGPDGNYLAEFGPYFTERHHTPWGAAVNLDGGAGTAGDGSDDATEVRAFVVDNALRWLRDFHVDALRLDAVHALIDDSPRHLLAELSDAVAGLEREVGRPLSLIAESDLNDAAMVTPTGEHGYGMTAQWDDDLHHALHALVTGERHGYYVDFGSPETIAKALTEVFVHDGTWSTFRAQEWGAPVPDDIDGRRFVVFSQNHDQVGNRALGDRPSRVLGPGMQALSAAVVILGPGTPMLFMGEEWGATTPFQYFTDHNDELGELVREGRRKEFGTHGWAELYGDEDLDVPDPQAPATFEASRLSWNERERPEHARLLRFYRDLVELRRVEPDIASGDRSATSLGRGEGWLVMSRGTIDVVLALEAGAVPVAGSPEPILSWDPVEVGDGLVSLPGPGVAVLRQSAGRLT